MPDNMHFDLRQLTSREFASLGLEDLAYVKPARRGDRDAYAIHAADGRELAVVASRDVAMATVWQNELEPVSVH